MAELLTEEELSVLTPKELKAYEQLLLREVAGKSPLELACYLAPETRRYPHVEMLDEMLVALVEYRLYASGPGPESRLYYTILDWDSQEETVYPALDMDSVPWEDNDLGEVFYAHPEDPSDKVILRLGIAMPPRHGKSYMVSEWLPLWYWLRYPDRDMALATYNDDFATSEWGLKLRQKLNEFGPKLGLILRGGERAATDNMRLETEDGRMLGRMKFVGAGGTLTGIGWGLGIIDDPFKNQEDAMSEAIRRNKANWYTSTWRSRRTKKNGMIPVEIMMFTRWHEEDLAGQFVYNEDGSVKDDWYMLHIPALAVDDDDPLGRRPGEALQPRIMTVKELMKVRDEDPTWFAALYQGDPRSLAAGMFGEFQRFRTGKREGRPAFIFDGGYVLEEDCVFFETIDLAATLKTYSDYSVIMLVAWHRETQQMFVVNIVRERIEAATHNEWVMQHHDPRAVFTGVENRTYGQSVIQFFQRNTQHRINVRPLSADQDKVARAIPVADMSKAGRVFVKDDLTHLAAFENECNLFPTSGKHDDMVDTLAYAGIESGKLPVPFKRVFREKTIEEKCYDQIERRRRQGGRSRLAM